MSKKHNQLVSFWTDVSDFLWRSKDKFRYQGMQLHKTDQMTVARAYALWAACLKSFLQGALKPNSLSRWLTILVDTPVDEVASVMKFVDTALFKSGESFDSYYAFKQHIRSVSPASGALIAPLKEELEHYISFELRDVSVRTKQLRSVLLFCSRLTLRHTSCEETSWSKYFANRERVGKHVTDPKIVSMLAGIIHEWYGGYSKSDIHSKFVPAHGSGSVAEIGVEDIGQKYNCINTPLVRYMHAQCGLMQLPLAPSVPTCRVSRVTAVPKGISEKRIISMEPAALMFLQHGLRKFLDFAEHPVLRKHVDLRDQTLSQELAREASISRMYATVDLSSASDSVSNSLVCALFGDLPLGRYLQVLRSTHTNVDGHIQRAEFFAPMGSDLCFPVECIVFCAISELAIRLSGSKLKKFRVYGDDCIIPVEAYAIFCHLLTECGFLVNLDKSFSGLNPFREACGGEYIDGIDVAPVRLSRRFTGSRITVKSPSSICTLIDLANRSFGLFDDLRLVCLFELDRLPPGKKVYFTDDRQDTASIFSPTPTNYRSEVRRYARGSHTDDPRNTCIMYQRDEVKTCLITAVTPKEDRSRDPLLKLYEWLRSREYAPYLSTCDKRMDTRVLEQVVVSRWRPTLN